MGWLSRLIGGLIRTVVIIGLIAIVLLVGLAYLDGSGIANTRVNRVLADTVGPRVATAVEDGGDSVLDHAGSVVRAFLSKADQALGQVVLSAAAPHPAGTPSAMTETDARALLDLINQYRASRGLKAWQWDDRLASFGQWRADDMIARNYFSHNDPGTHEILLAKLPTLVSVGENLFQVSGPAVRFMQNVNDEVLKGWQNSPAHNELLLAPNMTRGALAFARTDTRIVAVLVAAE